MFTKQQVCVLQRLQATKENTNGDTASPVHTPQEKVEEPSPKEPQEEVQTENVSLTPIPKQQQPEETKEPERPEEASLTPPLLPSMKVKEQAEGDSVKNQNDKLQDGKDKEKEKNKKNQWDMFAEQDIFKANTDVSFIICMWSYIFYYYYQYKQQRSTH